jgi:hypothetical protein
MSDNNKRILEAEDQRLKLSAEAIQSMKAGLTFAFEYIVAFLYVTLCIWRLL